MAPAVWAVFALTLSLDVLGQTAFKLGLRAIGDASRGSAFWLAIAKSPWIAAGVAGYAIEAGTWMYVLGHAPMSVVGPMAALAYVGALVAGRVALGERLHADRIGGAMLVTVGAALLALTTR